MNTKKLMIGTGVALIVSFILGGLIYGMALSDYMQEHSSQTAEPNMLYIILGHLFLSLLITYIFVKWATISTFKTGFQAGSVIGLLIALGLGFTLLGGASIYTGVVPVLLDGIIGAVMWGLAGGAAAWAIGKWGE